MNSVDKALLALDCLSKAGDGLSLGSLASMLGLKKNSLHRTLSALRYRGYVIQDAESGNYHLGPTPLRLADNDVNENRLLVAFQPILRDLSAEVNELCHLGILDGTDIVCMGRVEPALSVRVWTTVGQRSAAVTSALGRAILAFLQTDFDSFSGKFCNPIPQRTPQTQTDPYDVWDEVQAARRRGYAIEHQQSQEGVSCVAFPVLRKGFPILSISVTAPSERMSSARISKIVAKTRELLTARLPIGLAIPGPHTASANINENRSRAQP
jgi:DNA-binding IclR family transcriptional regulator